VNVEANLARLRLFKYAGLGLLFVGLFATLVLVVGDAEGVPRRL
jgi:hypothetical protein